MARACEFIEAHLTGPITLTRLEEVTGLGARALQLAFQARLQCAPLEWVLRRRLERARLALLSGAAGLSVRDVARRHGFLQAGHFARLYRRAFGELPSETRGAATRLSGPRAWPIAPQDERCPGQISGNASRFSGRTQRRLAGCTSRMNGLKTSLSAIAHRDTVGGNGMPWGSMWHEFPGRMKGS